MFSQYKKISRRNGLLVTTMLAISTVSLSLPGSATQSISAGSNPLSFDQGPDASITSLEIVNQGGNDWSAKYFTSTQPKFKLGDEVIVDVGTSSECGEWDSSGTYKITFMSTSAPWYFETEQELTSANQSTGALACTGTVEVQQLDQSDSIQIGRDILPGDNTSRNYYNVITVGGVQVDARVTYVNEQDMESDGPSPDLANAIEQLDAGDTDAGANKWLNTNIDFETGLGDSWAEFKIEFFTNLDSNPTPVSLSNFSVSVYDIDDDQYFEASGYTRYLLDSATELNVTTVGDRTRFYEPDALGSGSYDTNLSINNSSYTVLRVTLEYNSPVQTFIYRLGQNTSSADTGGASFELDFSAGWNVGGAWLDSIQTTSNPVAAAAPAAKPYEGPLNLSHSGSICSGSDAVITGQRLNTIEAVYVGDKLVPHTLLADGRLSYSLKDIPAGNYTVKFWVPVNSINLTDQIRVGSCSTSPAVTTPGTFTATKLFANYRGDRGPVVARDLAAITTFIQQYPGITNVTCVGSTSGVPAKSTDPALARARAKNACDAIQKLVPNAAITLATSTGKGVGQRFRSVTVTISGTR